MVSLFVSPINEIQTIAVIDDIEGSERSLPYWEAEIAGFRTLSVGQELRSMQETIDFICAHAQAAICTHRLAPRGTSHFYGAELVAALYDLNIPAVLITQYTDIDQHTTIRKWRDKVPVVLHLRQATHESLPDAFRTCLAELHNQKPENRKPYRVMLHIVDIQTVEDEPVIDVIVGHWDHYQVVRFPMTLIPMYLHNRIALGTWLFANVNIKADYCEDLYFQAIDLAPEPQYEEDLVYCVNVEQANAEDWTVERWDAEYARLSELENFEI
jgi:hypothetical protein